MIKLRLILLKIFLLHINFLWNQIIVFFFSRGELNLWMHAMGSTSSGIVWIANFMWNYLLYLILFMTLILILVNLMWMNNVWLYHKFFFVNCLCLGNVHFVVFVIWFYFFCVLFFFSFIVQFILCVLFIDN